MFADGAKAPNGSNIEQTLATMETVMAIGDTSRLIRWA